MEADAESRRKHAHELEWSISARLFDGIVATIGWSPTTDRFAARLNYKLKPFYAFRPDPEAAGCDAFTVDWSTVRFYAFPLFTVISKVLRKVYEDGATGIIIVPKWEAQPWYLVLLSMLIGDVVNFPRSSDILSIPLVKGHHPLGRSL